MNLFNRIRNTMKRRLEKLGEKNRKQYGGLASQLLRCESTQEKGKTVKATVYITIAVAPLIFAFLASGVRAHEGEPHAAITLEGDVGVVQETCPVMVGNKIDPDIFTEYRGKKVYFCCESCKAAFEAEPEKYVDRLPQFSDDKTSAGETHGFAWYRLIVPFGITALSLLVLTFLAGWFMRLNRKLLFKWHKRLAIATLIVALSHLLLVILFR